MEHWKRLIPSVAGASLALGSQGCGGSDGGGGGGGISTSVVRAKCTFQQTCHEADFAYASVDACVTALAAKWNTELAPDFRAMGGAACESDYLAAYECYVGLLNDQTCVDPTDPQIAAACGSYYDSVLADCTNPGGHGAAITALAQGFCADYQACEPAYFASNYATTAECVAARRLKLAWDIAPVSSACQTAALAYDQCFVDAYTSPACSTYDAMQACTTQRTAAETACGGVIPLTGGSANKSRAPGEEHRPRWLRAAR